MQFCEAHTPCRSFLILCSTLLPHSCRISSFWFHRPGLHLVPPHSGLLLAHMSRCPTFFCQLIHSPAGSSIVTPPVRRLLMLFHFSHHCFFCGRLVPFLSPCNNRPPRSKARASMPPVSPISTPAAALSPHEPSHMAILLREGMAHRTHIRHMHVSHETESTAATRSKQRHEQARGRSSFTRVAAARGAPPLRVH